MLLCSEEVSEDFARKCKVLLSCDINMSFAQKAL